MIDELLFCLVENFCQIIFFLPRVYPFLHTVPTFDHLIMFNFLYKFAFPFQIIYLCLASVYSTIMDFHIFILCSYSWLVLISVSLLEGIRFVFIETEQCKRDSKVSCQGDKLSYEICSYCSRWELTSTETWPQVCQRDKLSHRICRYCSRWELTCAETWFQVCQRDKLSYRICRYCSSWELMCVEAWS
jgi:hypothetical protein